MSERAARAVVVMGRLPERGRVKTRLAARLGPEVAAELYRAFLLDVFDLVDEAARIVGATRCFSVAAEGEAALALARALIPSPSWRVIPQSGATLGDRIEAARAGAGAKTVLILGSDAPHMPRQRLVTAFDQLAAGEVDVVLGPTQDGGYDLIGFNRPCPEILAQIPWSTPRVLGATRAAATQAGLRLVELDLGRDVDELADLEAMLEVLGPTEPDRGRRSWAAARLALAGLRQKPLGEGRGPTGSH